MRDGYGENWRFPPNKSPYRRNAKVLMITNRKSHMGFRLVPKSTTLCTGLFLCCALSAAGVDAVYWLHAGLWFHVRQDLDTLSPYNRITKRHRPTGTQLLQPILRLLGVSALMGILQGGTSKLKQYNLRCQCYFLAMIQLLDANRVLSLHQHFCVCICCSSRALKQKIKYFYYRYLLFCSGLVGKVFSYQIH